LPRDVFFFFGATGFPLAAACFCFFFAGILNLLALAREASCNQDRAWLPRAPTGERARPR
jgi:hypothetical protein